MKLKGLAKIPQQSADSDWVFEVLDFFGAATITPGRVMLERISYFPRCIMDDQPSL